MKKKFTFQNLLLFVLILAGIYRFSYLSAEKSKKSITITGDTLGFINYVTAPGWVDTAPENYWNITNQFDSYKELNYNTSHMFVTDAPSMGNFNQDALTPLQIDSLNRIISMSGQAGLNCYLERVRISALCYSQRLTYEAEGGNYGFSYQRRTANIETDGDRTVVHACINTAECPETDATPRMLCDSIYENLQHTDLYYFWPGSTDNFRWKIKPVMKIKQSDFSPVDTTPVVAVYTKNYFGNYIDTTIIKVNSFGLNNYSGEYIQSYFRLDHPLEVNGHIDSANSLSYGRPAPGEPIKDCKVDFQVYWYGQVDVWFDKMIVDDERADKLFNLDTNQNFDKRIRDEVITLGDNIIYYVDELTSSQTSTTKYVRDKMRDYSNGKATMQFALSNNINLYSHRDSTTRNKMLFDSIQPDIVCLDDHVFQLWGNDAIYLPDNIQNFDSRVPPSWKISPDSYNTLIQEKAFGNKTERVIDQQGTFIYQITKIRNDLKDLSPLTKFVVQPHIHSWTQTVENIGFLDNGFREPTNQEIQASGLIAIAHGAQGLSWVNYQSNESSNINSIGDTVYSPDTSFVIVGLRNEDQTKRTQNIIYQNKWEYVKAMNLKILHWKPTLDKIKWDNGYSVHYETADHKFIKDIKSLIVRPGPQTACYEDNINYDCSEERYWEMGFFNPDFTNPSVSSNDKSKYFIMVNRRCVPDETNDGDLRQLKIKFDSTDLAGFVNWKIIELDSHNVVTVFNKNTTSYIDMGIYQPGEGRLYKLAPVMQEGGTLVANEECIGNFTCKGLINNNGKNITIKPATIISFTDSGRITMDSGKFYSGYTASNQVPLPVELKSSSSTNWKGINLSNCSEVKITNTTFKNITSGYLGALQLTNCLNKSMINNTFTEIDTSIFALSLDYILTGKERRINLLVNQNQFTNCEKGLRCSSFGSVVIPITLDGNSFNTSSGDIAVWLSNISGGVVKNNFINNYLYGINFISSTTDLYKNIITSTLLNSNSISEESYSNINIGKSGKYYTGGKNNFNSGDENINCDNSSFNIDYGYNTFNIRNSGVYHFDGTFPYSQSDISVPAVENCFHLNSSITSPTSNVKYFSTNNLVQFQYTPTNCNPVEPTEYEVIAGSESGSEWNDTLYYEEEGSGGGMSGSSDLSSIESDNLKTLFDSVNIGIRMKNYDNIISNSLLILDSYSDSIQSVNVISKLYLANLRIDSTGNKMNTLKTYLETLILNTPNNTPLINQCFYFIQKCKVALEDYQSAMSGFQQIIDQNPYSYEGLVASWDYAATSLLQSGGSGGGEKELEFGISDLGFGI